jgi:MoaD family protein
MVKLYANLRLVAGLKEITISADNLGELLTELVHRIPALESHLLQDGQVRRHVIIVLNGHNVSALVTPLSEADEVAIFPPIAGGSYPLNSPICRNKWGIRSGKKEIE